MKAGLKWKKMVMIFLSGQHITINVQPVDKVPKARATLLGLK